jgi:exopolysaccharide production protein ExoZ
MHDANSSECEPTFGNDGIEPSVPESRSAPPAVAPNSELPGTIISIQVLRFAAAFVVVLFHAHVALVRSFPHHLADQIDHAFQVGASGVHIFFVISGFVMVYTSIRSRLTSGGFLKRRLIRIYPIYWVIFTTYLVVHQFLGNPYHVSVGDIVKAALLLPGYSAMVIGPGWTLSFEMYFYVCFALALFAGVRRGLVTLTIVYSLSVLAGRLAVAPAAIGNTLTDSLLLEFVAGAWLGFAYSRGFAVTHRIGAILIAVAIVLFASGFWVDYKLVPSIVCWGIPSLLLVTGALAFEPELRSGTGRFFGRLGDSSYLLYLSHVLVIDLLLATPISLLNRNEAWAIAISLPLALLCTGIAAGGYRTIELPLLNAMKRMTMRGRRIDRRDSGSGLRTSVRH